MTSRVFIPHLGGRFLVAPLCLAMAVVFFGGAAPEFLSLGNLQNIATQMWLLALLSIGQMFAIASRGFDISVGATAALASTAAALGANAFGLPGLLAGPIAGLAVGTLNGALVGVAGIQPIVATLGTLIAVRGIALLLTDDGQVVPLVDAAAAARMSFNPVLGLPLAYWAAILLVCLAALILNRSVIGRRIVMLGSNPEAVRLVGIGYARTQIRAYQLCSLYAGFAGVLLTLRAGTGLPTEGAGMELQAIAAAVIGGTALSGGVARVVPVVLGAAFIQALLTGLNLQGVSPFVAQIAVGLVIIGSGLLEYAIRHFFPVEHRSWT
ncbi:ABC transporter permease [Microvirga antarctica]|uniref:ABC transporter permease n=1 Tax=Microvirga antarctica TaxID=2819233 RepID=UPI001B315F36|nr:ABC transporter permease [Microvirga antarctica]